MWASEDHTNSGSEFANNVLPVAADGVGGFHGGNLLFQLGIKHCTETDEQT